MSSHIAGSYESTGPSKPADPPKSSKTATVDGAPPITQQQVTDCHHRLTSIERDYLKLADQQRTRAARARRLERQITHLGRLAMVRAYFDDFALKRVGPILVLTAVGALVGVIVLGVVSLNLMFAGIVGGCVVGLLLALHLFVVPSDPVLQRWSTANNEELRKLQIDLASDEPRLRHAKGLLDEVQAQYEALIAAFQSYRNALRLIEWRSLRGTAFEQFLRSVFELLGFRATLTKASGDQGVDIIVEKQGLKMAVQAKGFDPAIKVANNAIQEAHTGMAFYRCDACAVITSSSFTSPAMELANRVGCHLVDGTQIDELIMGQVWFPPNF